jgi:hypothetical protein
MTCEEFVHPEKEKYLLRVMNLKLQDINGERNLNRTSKLEKHNSYTRRNTEAVSDKPTRALKQIIE